MRFLFTLYHHICMTVPLRTGTFPLDWKKGNVLPIFKKGDKQIYENYRPVSLLPILGKILERLIFEEMFPFFIENKLIAANQSGFKNLETPALTSL